MSATAATPGPHVTCTTPLQLVAVVAWTRFVNADLSSPVIQGHLIDFAQGGSISFEGMP